MADDSCVPDNCIHRAENNDMGNKAVDKNIPRRAPCGRGGVCAGDVFLTMQFNE